MVVMMWVTMMMVIITNLSSITYHPPQHHPRHHDHVDAPHGMMKIISTSHCEPNRSYDLL